MAAPLGVLAAGPAAAITKVEDIDGRPLEGAAGMSDSGHHRSWRRRWQAPWGSLAAGLAVLTTKVGDVDGGPPRSAAGRSGSAHH
jgi:hypothetical protein